MIVNFITLKWGTKYGPEYVNRLYWTLKNTYSSEFVFHCITDNNRGLDKNIKTIKLKKNFSKVFTIQKIQCMSIGHEIQGNKVLLDLDILIQNDLYPYLLEYNFYEPRFCASSWQDKEHVLETIHIASCFVNSSFVTWKEDQLDFLYKFYMKYNTIIEQKYNSFDKSLFANFYDILRYHKDNLIYSYSFDNKPKTFKKDALICIFLTSHGEGIELHDADGWAKEMWCRYDK
jgi:hypothetical protein